MPPIIDIELDCDANDGRKTIVICKDKDCPKIDSTLEQKFIDLISPLGLPNPKGVYLLAHHIKHGKLVDETTNVPKLKLSKYQKEMFSLMEMLLDFKDWDNLEDIKIVFSMKDKNDTRSVSFKSMRFYADMIDYLLMVFTKKFTFPTSINADSERINKWPQVMQQKVAELNKIKKINTKLYKHRPASNTRIYCMQLLFFGILGITPNKPNCNLMIQILQLMGLWKDGQKVDDSTYKLIVRQWKTAKVYKLLFLKTNFPNKSVYEGIEGLTFIDTI